MPPTRVTTQEIRDNSIVNTDVASNAAIDASKIANGTVSNTEYQYLDGTTSNIQSQINGLVTKTPATSSVNIVKSLSSGVTSLTLDSSTFASPGSNVVFQVRGVSANPSFTITEVDDGLTTYAQVDVFRSQSLRLNNGCQLVLEDADGSHAISLSVPNLAANYTLTFPASAGSSGQFLTTSGGGTLAFTSHGNSGDPHTQYIIKTPVIGTNIIDPEADVPALVIQGNAASSSDVELLSVYDRNNLPLLTVVDSSPSSYILTRHLRAVDGYTIVVGTRSWYITTNATGSEGSFTFRLPSNGNGVSGQLLRTDGAGNTSWVNPSSGVAGVDAQVQFNDGGSAFGGDPDFTWNKNTNTLTLGSTSVSGNVVLLNQGALVLREATAGGSNTMSIRAASAINSDFTLTFPADAGASGQVLRSDGTGALTWVPNISSLNTLTSATQTFAKTDDTNVTLAINSATSTHTFAMGWTGTLSIARGGTGAGTKTSASTHYLR